MVAQCLRVMVATAGCLLGGEASKIAQVIGRVGAWSGSSETLGRTGCSVFSCDNEAVTAKLD